MPEELNKIPLPSNNDKSIEDLEEFPVHNEEDQLNLGLSILGKTNTLDETTPPMKVNSKPLEVEVVKGDDTEMKELGYISMINRNASKVKKLFNINSSKKITLFHSGFNVGCSNQTPASKLALQVALASTQAEVGFTTLGIGFSNESVMVVKQVIESLSTSIEVSTLRQHEPFKDALITDLQHIMLLAMDKEIIILQTCTNQNEDGSNCNNVHEYIADWKNLIQVDRTKVDLSFLGKSKVTSKDVDDFRSYITSKTINTSIEDMDVEIKLKIPTIGYYLDYGEYWLAEVNKIVDSIVAEPSSITRRTMLTSTFNVNEIQLYGHFIESIKIGDNEEINELSDIIECVSLIHRREHSKIVSSIKEYIKDNTFSVIGVPSYRCTKCDNIMESELPTPFEEEVVSINMVKTFLELTNLNLTKMVNE